MDKEGEKMAIVGMMIKGIHASKSEEVTGNVKVNNGTNIKDAHETELALLNKKGIAVEFEFKTSYQVGNAKKPYAEIIINGDILLVEEKHKDILDKWKKEKKLPDHMNIVIVNAVLRKCLIEALQLSEKLNLPPPLVLPFATEKAQEEKESRYIG